MGKFLFDASNIQNSTNSVKSRGVLKTGDSVYVRVLSNLGNNKYSVSFAGNRFEVTSHSPLEIGNSFKALIQVKNGMILLTPEFNPNVNSSNQFISIQNYLMALGLPNDIFSKQLLELFVGMGLKFDTKLSNKIRLIAFRFPGKEKEAAEIALALVEKGIDPDESSVRQIFSILYGNFNNRHSKNENAKQKNSNCDSKKNKNTIGILNELYNSVSEVLSRKLGLLTFFNHTSSSKNHWILLPIKYQIPLANGIKTATGIGNIRILFDLQEKKAKKTILFLKFYKKQYRFVLEYDCVKFCIVPNILKEEQRSSEELLTRMIGRPSLKIQYEPELEKQNLFSKAGTIPFFYTEV